MPTSSPPAGSYLTIDCSTAPALVFTNYGYSHQTTAEQYGDIRIALR